MKACIKLANREYQIEAIYKSTILYFSRFLSGKNHPLIIKDSALEYCEEELEKKDLNDSIRKQLSVDSVQLKEEIQRLDSSPEYAEYSLFVNPVANRLISSGCTLFHGVAFLWRGKVVILTGRSGIGKSTHFWHWKNVYRDQVEMISGDKPILDFSGERIRVFPSPWNGKENWYGEGEGILSAIILLEQGTENQLERFSSRECVFPLFLQFLCVPDEQDTIDRVCSYEEKLIRHVPVWKLVNKGDVDSARLLHDELERVLFHEIQDS